MRIHLDFAPLVAVLLLSLRLGVLIVASPVFASLTRLTTIRVLLTLGFSLALVFGLHPPLRQVPLTLAGIVPAAMLELVLGSTMAFGVFAAFGVFSVAGKLLDIQSGFGLASVFDPITRASSPIFAQLLNLLALTVFFGLDGHHALMRGVAFSVEQVPPGTSLASLPLIPAVRQFGLMFSLALSLIAPVLFGLFLVEAAIALMSRVMPQMNVLVIGIPVKIVIGLAIFALSLGLVLPIMGKVFGTIFIYWEQVLA